MLTTFGDGQMTEGFAVVIDKQGNPVELVASNGAEALLAKVRELGPRLHA